MQRRPRGRPKDAERPTTPQRLGAMLSARHTMHRLIARIDARLYNSSDQALTTRGFDALVEQAIAALTRLRGTGWARTIIQLER